MNNSVAHVLELRNLKMRYPTSLCWVLQNVNLTIDPGESLALVGPSGSGKSSIAKTLLQLTPSGSICEGEILVNGIDPRKVAEKELRRLRGEVVGLVFQDPMTRLNPLMTIGGHLIDTLKAHRPSRDKFWYRQKSEELLDRVGIDPARFGSYPHEFSGGMRQRVVIALALALNPSLIIADEPTTSLDVTVANQIMTELTNLCDELGTSLLLITHDLAIASNWCERIAILDQGNIVEEGFSRKILNSPESLVGKSLVSAARARERIRTSKVFDSYSLVLEVNDLRCWHSLAKTPFQRNWLKAVDGISFILREGEILGLVGVSGCGKSTLCWALMGLLPLRSGEIKLLGKSLKINSHKSYLRKHIQMVFQDPLGCLNPKMRIWEIIIDPLLIHKICSKSKAKEKARYMLSQVGLNPPEIYQDRFPKELSGGQQQRVAIARSIVLEPKILICDESLSMLDPQIQSEILDLLTSLKDRLNLAILMITHDLNVARGFCDNILVLDQGKVIDQGTDQELTSNPKNLLTKKLFESTPRLL